MQPGARTTDRLGDAFPDHPTPWTAASLGDPLYLLSKVGSRGTKLYAEALKPLELRPRHVAALRFLADREGASQRDLVEGLWSDSSSVVTLLDEFEARGLAERRRNQRDRRAYAVHLTTKGYELLETALDVSRAVEDRVLERLTPDE